jgi:hypothetical protein
MYVRSFFDEIYGRAYACSFCHASSNYMLQKDVQNSWCLCRSTYPAKKQQRDKMAKMKVRFYSLIPKMKVQLHLKMKVKHNNKKNDSINCNRK